MSETLQVVIQLATLGGILATCVLFIVKPNAKQDTSISSMKASCDERHKGIEEKFSSINGELTLIRENHLKHIEEDVKNLQIGQTRIITILEERERKTERK